MPHSWIKVSRYTSSKLHNCMDGDHSRPKFEGCIQAIVNDDGGRVENIRYEVNGRFARVEFYWDTLQQKNQIIFDLEGDDVIDLLDTEESSQFGE